MSRKIDMESHWRRHAAPIITRVLAETKGASEKEIRKALHDAYPYGPRRYHPYKIWLDEIRRQRNGGRGVVIAAPGEKLVFPNAPISR